tara:strand:+ start:929 stop:1252 length:324 start_codon:yes stop_codon:yes gene_type:complete
MIALTEEAAKAVQGFFSSMDPKPIGIRVGVQGGGCSGFTYQMKYAYSVDPADREIESNGVKIIIDRKSLLYLMGTVIDYKNELGQVGFKFENPTAKRTCGCGESFGI